MLLFYNLGIRLYQLLIQLACLKSSKARSFIKGRENLLKRIEHAVMPGDQHVWFHFASLGEFEQGRPVIEKMKSLSPQCKIFITFFSPSGFEVRKNYPLAEHIFYLPIDSKHNAEKFIQLINPTLAVFTKYEYWYYFFTALKKSHVPLYIISGIFRPNQPFFQWYGSLHRKMLTCVTHFFVQNQESDSMLQQLGFRNITVSGDTRFDRVYENSKSAQRVKAIEDFCGESSIFICGSTWLPDEKLISSVYEMFPDWKFIIAPHEVGEGRIKEIAALFPDSIRFTRLQSPGSEARTLIIDNIGMLSSLYQYGDIAYIGGGFGAGIHNTLEAAAFGLPVIFGPNFEKFKEAKDLLELKAAFPVTDGDTLVVIFQKLNDESDRRRAGSAALKYVEANTGATSLILKHINYPLN